MSSSPASPGPVARRNPIVYVAAGCALIAICALCAAAAGGAYFYSTKRQVARGPNVPSIEYILDATARMAQKADGENDTRLNVARGVLAEIVRPSDPAVTAGLRVFGTGAQAAACSDTSLLVPLAPASQTQISTHLLALTTGSNAAAAMSQAMISAIADLAPLSGKHTLVVVTGGADSCSPQAGQLIEAEAKKAGIDLQMFVVGYQVPEGDGTAIQGLVDATGSNFVSADTKDQLTHVLTTIQTFAQDSTTTDVTGVMATAAAAVGTQNVVVPGTPQGGTPVAQSTPVSGGTPEPNKTPVRGTPAPTAVTTGSGSGGTGQTACDHPYWPLRPGATWTFSGDTGDQTWTISNVTGDTSNAAAEMQFKVSDTTITFHWTCSPDGINSYDFGSVNTAGSGGNVSFSVVKHSGTFLPSADKLVKGAQWDSAYTLQTSIGTVNVTDDVQEHFTAAGIESVTVAGQTRDALRVDIASTITVTGASGPTTINGTSSYWLVRGVGPVKFVSNFDNSSSTSTLTSYSIP